MLYGFVLTDGTQPRTRYIHVDLSDLGVSEELKSIKSEMFQHKKKIMRNLSDDLDSSDMMKLISAMRIKVFDEGSDVEHLKA